MAHCKPNAEAADLSNEISAHRPSSRAVATLRRLISGERVRGLRELDDFLLRDIGASGDDIWRVHRLRNGDRPTLMVG
ncbi:MAG: hypothetical protein ACK4TL_01985 [Hyphomicrobiaceae bacterium]